MPETQGPGGCWRVRLEAGRILVMNRRGKLTPLSLLQPKRPPNWLGQFQASRRLFFLSNSFFKIYFIDYAITGVPFPPFTPLHPAHPLPPTFPPYSSCPRVIHISSYSFYISYTIPTLPLSIFYLPFMLPILCTFTLSTPLTPLWITLHVSSISVVLFLF